jgi:hypothetical protein
VPGGFRDFETFAYAPLKGTREREYLRRKGEREIGQSFFSWELPSPTSHPPTPNQLLSEILKSPLKTVFLF